MTIRREKSYCCKRKTEELLADSKFYSDTAYQLIREPFHLIKEKVNFRFNNSISIFKIDKFTFLTEQLMGHQKGEYP